MNASAWMWGAFAFTYMQAVLALYQVITLCVVVNLVVKLNVIW
jgi:hypothetical protein